MSIWVRGALRRAVALRSDGGGVTQEGRGRLPRAVCALTVAGWVEQKGRRVARRQSTAHLPPDPQGMATCSPPDPQPQPTDERAAGRGCPGPRA